MRSQYKYFIVITVISFILIMSYIYTESKDEKRAIFDPDIYLDNEAYKPVTIEDVLKKHEKLIQQELQDYKFPPGVGIDDLMLKTNGRPLRNVIAATWRSGSTFLGDIINSVPGNYYHYEPLLNYGITQIRGPPYSEMAIKNLRDLLNCDYSNLDTYLDYGMTHTYLFSHNKRLWRQCDIYPQYCWSDAFLSQLCKQFPFQSMKTVRIRLQLLEELLIDKNLNIRILLLVRDPRGMIQSRKHRDWCPGVPDCDQPSIICDDMLSDYKAAKKFLKLYPTQFRVFRYEDFSVNLEKSVKELLEFFNLYYHPAVMEFLDSHTKINVGDVWSTYRDSKNAPFHWKVELPFSEVQFIQNSCQEAMRLWGYANAVNESHLQEFNPVGSFIPLD